MPHYSRALELQPDDVDASAGLTRALQLLGQPDKALPYLDRAARRDPFDPSAHYRLGGLYRAQGRAADVEREFAEFRRLRHLKQGLLDAYKVTHVQPSKPGLADPEAPK